MYSLGLNLALTTQYCRGSSRSMVVGSSEGLGDHGSAEAGSQGGYA